MAFWNRKTPAEPSALAQVPLPDELRERHPNIAAWQEGLRAWQDNLEKRRDELDARKERQDARVAEIAEMSEALERQKTEAKSTIKALEAEIDMLSERKRALAKGVPMDEALAGHSNVIPSRRTGPKSYEFELLRFQQGVWDDSFRYIVDVDEEGEVSSRYEKIEPEDSATLN